MRGKGNLAKAGGNYKGITPAYAGKSGWGPGRRWRIWDHPRVCGEKAESYVNKHPEEGSPPRMRGKVGKVILGALDPRITPAYAGKRAGAPGSPCTRGDHPRVCGEKDQEIPQTMYEKGSPPRMRGKGRQPGGGCHRGRITPAYAGKRRARARIER